MTRTGLAARAALLLLIAAGGAASQEHAHPQGAASEKLGTVHLQTSCSSAVAPHFDRAVALLHSFEFGASIRAFTDVLAADSTCAMAHWGIALSRWTNPFVASLRSPAQLQQGKRAADEASRLGARATERERDYINAATQLYANYETVDQRARIMAYARAMRELVAKQPQDTEAKVFFALSLTASASPTDKSYVNQREAGSILEPLFAKQPNHPGLAHYIIHSYDYPLLAQQATGAANRYATIAPSAAHALHMPSHIFTRVGWWDASVNTNLRARETAQRDGSMGEALHASDYAVYAYLQMGRDSAARAAMSVAGDLAARFDVNAIGSGASGTAGVFAMAAIPARYALERRTWTEAASLEPKSSAYPWTEALVYFARSLGASHVGDLAKARASIDSLESIRDRLAKAGEAYWAEQVAIQRLGAQAWVAMAERKSDEALALMREAAGREDATEKNAVTPGPLAPARELLGDMLMDLGRPAEALVEYRATLTKEPNRFRAIYGAMRAASASGDNAGKAQYAAQLTELCANADRPGRAELTEIRR